MKSPLYLKTAILNDLVQEWPIPITPPRILLTWNLIFLLHVTICAQGHCHLFPWRWQNSARSKIMAAWEIISWSPIPPIDLIETFSARALRIKAFAYPILPSPRNPFPFQPILHLSLGTNSIFCLKPLTHFPLNNVTVIRLIIIPNTAYYIKNTTVLNNFFLCKNMLRG